MAKKNAGRLVEKFKVQTLAWHQLIATKELEGRDLLYIDHKSGIKYRGPIEKVELEKGNLVIRLEWQGYRLMATSADAENWFADLTLDSDQEWTFEKRKHVIRISFMDVPDHPRLFAETGIIKAQITNDLMAVICPQGDNLKI